ncbi:Hsp70 family protein [Limoniibacter endophyticus]|uniref:Heat-shock protein n=1 Tax=Limoniibacter endophyticus TaxID=1565040 RepID=A0A8J3DIN3_9HYPH|nr:Hsp70 family protein [Limoniibacter endophyticus]GHC71943.1 heat-shock protein [Limoniibacter endophyticus]
MTRIFSGIDFGTSNSTIGIHDGRNARLVPLEAEAVTLPSAIFYRFDADEILFGRAAIAAYVEGDEGRLMRALKSILGTSLIAEKTRIRARSVAFTDIVGTFFRHLRQKLEAETGEETTQVVLGRPVHFIDENAVADKQAEDTLREIAAAQGFRDIEFQYEPIAAALDYERQVNAEELVLIVDIGGGTSDFSLVRLSPERAKKAERQDDILANEGVHIGGTDFDRLLSIAKVMPQLGYGTWTRDGKRNLPTRYFHDLATWHRINSLYGPKMMNELSQVRYEAERRDLVDRLIRIVEERRGHSLALAVEKAKIELTDASRAEIELSSFIAADNVAIDFDEFDAIVGNAVGKVAAAMDRLLADAGVVHDAINTIFMTGGSSALPMLRTAVTSKFPAARIVNGDLLGSVGTGLAIDARAKFG